MSRSLCALVMGNADYDDAADALKNPTNDADDVSAVLEASGFTVTKKVNATSKEMDKALREFKANLQDMDVGLFFFAGRGVQIEGENYLAATNTKVVDEVEAKHSSLALNRVIQTMEKAGTSTNIIILDACRNNPWERAWNRSLASRGLAPVYAPRGTLIAYATSPGQTALDEKGRNGAYTAALLKHIRTPDCSVEAMFKRVRNSLSAATGEKQISWEHTSLAGEFFFNLGIGARVTEYVPTALSDKLLILDDARDSHVIIADLKSHTWDTQNAAMKRLTAANAAKFGKSSLFVIGRNVYQSACGGSRDAIAFIDDFVGRTKGLVADKRKALLDGMLLEVFFDPEGKVRDEPKMRRFNGVFDLQNFTFLQPSFDFIAECLAPTANRFYAIPGKVHEIAIEVMLEGSCNNEVRSVYYGTKNILRKVPRSWGDSGVVRFDQFSRKELEKKLGEQMLVPMQNLKVTYNKPVAGVKSLMLASDSTVRKA